MLVYAPDGRAILWAVYHTPIYGFDNVFLQQIDNQFFHTFFNLPEPFYGAMRLMGEDKEVLSDVVPALTTFDYGVVSRKRLRQTSLPAGLRFPPYPVRSVFL